MGEEQDFCKECCKKISKKEFELNKGLCTKCYLSRKKPNGDTKKSNNVAYIIKSIAIIGAIAGIILGCMQFSSYHTESLGILYIVISVISAVFVYALGEIIQLLEDIKNK